MLLVYRCIEITLSSWQATTLSSGVIAVPLAIPQALWTAGLAVACLVLLFALGRAGHALARGRVASAAASLTPYAAHEDEDAMTAAVEPDAPPPRSGLE